jgi:hypothetical protein
MLAGKSGEILAGPGAGGQRARLLLRRHDDLVQADAGAARVRGLVALVLEARLRLVHRRPGLELAGQHLAAHDRPLDVALQVLDRHPLPAQLALQLGVVGDVVLLLDSLDDLAHVFGPEPDPELGAALEDEHVVDGFLQQPRVVLAEVALDLGRRYPVLLHGGQLPGLELGEGHDVPVHARHDALEDLGARGGGHGHRESDANGQRQEL